MELELEVVLALSNEMKQTWEILKRKEGRLACNLHLGQLQLRQQVRLLQV
jgi:hypothetical protein